MLNKIKQVIQIRATVPRCGVLITVYKCSLQNGLMAKGCTSLSIWFAQRVQGRSDLHSAMVFVQVLSYLIVLPLRTQISEDCISLFRMPFHFTFHHIVREEQINLFLFQRSSLFLPSLLIWMPFSQVKNHSKQTSCFSFHTGVAEPWEIFVTSLWISKKWCKNYALRLHNECVLTSFSLNICCLLARSKANWERVIKSVPGVRLWSELSAPFSRV